MNRLHQVHSAFATTPLLLGAALLAGCKNKEAEVIERYKAQGLTQVERVRRVGELMRDRPSLQADSPSLPFENAAFRKCSRESNPPYGGAFVDAQWLTEEGLRKDYIDDLVTVDKFPFWGRCAAWLTTGANPDGSPPRGAKDIEEHLQDFLKVKYLGVARTVELRLPEFTGSDQFSGGRFRFDMFFFELTDPPKYIGGLRVDASNDPEVQVRYRDHNRYFEEKGGLLGNLQDRSDAALCTLMTERAKGSAVNPQPSE